MLFLKQSTASQSILIGPFIDDTDGATPETGLTIANTDIRLSKAGANIVAKNSGGGTADEAGWYTATLDATDTNTVGTLQGHVKVAGALMVQFQVTVLEEAIYDGIFASGAGALATAAALTTTQTDLDTITGSDGVTLATAQANYAPSTAAALATAQTDLDTLTGTDGATLATSQPNYAPSTAAALATAQTDLDTITGSDGVTLATAQGNYAPATASALTTVDTVVDAIKVTTDKLDPSASVILTGTASGTPSTTAMVSDIGITVDDQYKGRTIIFDAATSTAALQNQATDITACTAASNTLTFTALTTAGSSGDSFVIV
jgi:hypothetical protein|tara:strand:- start:419 stop:1378 length:960 start_codon:yes stop_codon:yes gene_type:complete